MRNRHTLLEKLVAVGLLLSPFGLASGWQPVVSAAQTAANAKPVPAADGNWPRAYTTTSNARVVLYQPQIGLWPDQKHMTMFAAVSYLAPGEQKPALGTLKIEADTQVALNERLVNFSRFTITTASFQTLSKDKVGAVVAEIVAAIPREDRVIGLDRVLAMVDTSAIKVQNTAGIKADPPVIFFSEKPSVLVNFDGDPIWSPIPNNELKFAVNTNWDVFEYAPEKTYFLRMNDSWLVAESIQGPWRRAVKLPGSFSTLPNDDNWKDVRAAVPGKPSTGTAPVVFVSMVPAELIRLSGAPTYAPVPGTQLVWVSNTDSDVFRLRQDGPVFYLVAGRWFSAPQFTGPWTFVTPTLPEDFKKIPLDFTRSRVLASVPGTRQAVEAVLLAQIPQTAIVKRKELPAPEVAYQGEPKFEPIAQTTVARAVNTDKDIIKTGDLYFMCFQGVWFRSTTANGPWEVADSVPQEIYQIPISSPAHNVTYVTVEDSNADEVEFLAEAAYSGMMIGWGVSMWESGWYYPPYYYGGAYYGYYPTYGYGASYNPWTGAYSRGGGVYGPYGGAGYGARYNPSTGTYSRGAVAYGPNGARGAASAFNPRTGTAAATRQGSGVYGSWGSTAVQRGDQWASTSRLTNRATGNTTRATQGSGGGAAVTRRGSEGLGGVARTGSGDVYAGRDGNVYRNQGGSWQQYNNGSWNNTTRQGSVGTTGRLGDSGVTPAMRDQLNRDRAARADGARRTSDFGRVQSGGSRISGGSYRPSAGGFSRGGGGMRGGGRR